MVKVIRVFAALVLLIALANGWSYLVYLTGTGEYHGPGRHWIKEFSLFPSVVQESLNTIDVRHGTLKSDSYLDMPQDFQAVDKLTYDLYALNSYWSYGSSEWEFKLTDLRTDSVLHHWQIDKDSLVLSPVQNLRNLRPKHALLLKGRSIVINFRQSPNLIRLDSASRIVWVNRDLSYHHSMNLDADSNIWVCASHDVANVGRHTEWWNVPTTKVRDLDGQEVKYKDDHVVQIDHRTGKILLDRSVSKILLDNGYAGLLYGGLRVDVDPIHLNDIEPALSDTRYWKKGDVFLSMRHLSTVCLYRPSLNKILWLRTGPALYQHDIDILSDSTICVFNNNYIDNEQPDKYEEEPVSEIMTQLGNSQIVTYDFAADKWGTLFDDLLSKEGVSTEAEGLQHVLSNGDVYFEEVRGGRVFVLGKQGLLLRKVFNTTIPGKIHRPNWLRIYEQIPD